MASEQTVQLLPEFPSGYTRVECLPHLKGRAFDEVARAYLTALRPSSIRLLTHNAGEYMDARTWRVSIYLDENEKIDSIWQEVEVALPEGVQNGYELDQRLRG